jgi:hypothetical protein
MALSLNPEINALTRLYELSEVAGVRMEDDPNYLGIEALPINWAGGGEAYELTEFLSGTPTVILKRLRLRWQKITLIEYAESSVFDWFQWDAIEGLIEANKLCDECGRIFQEFRERFADHESGLEWEGIEKDCRSILNDLETCATCSAHYNLEAKVEKDALINEFLIGELQSSGKKVSGLVWYNPEKMERAFSNFHEFLEFIAGKIDRPLALFFYQPLELYEGYYFKILSLHPEGLDAAQTEKELAARLNSYTTTVLNDYAMLYADHTGEKRTGHGERFNIPPTLFLRQTGELASYPLHPLFTSGPLRSLLIYAMLAWLAHQADREAGATVFTLPTDEADPIKVPLNFSQTNVLRAGESIFIDGQWSKVSGRLARDIERSVGSEYFQDCWSKAMAGLRAEDFTADKLFATLETIRQASETLRLAPPKEIKNLTPDLALYIHVDTNNKQLVFQLGYLNPSLGLSFEHPDSLSINLEERQIPLVELNELAKRHLISMLDNDKNNPALKIPNMEKLMTRGQALWDDMIPPELKRAYARLRGKKDLTLFIFSEDHSYPWELIKPYELKNSKIDADGFDDEWWALQFGIARWAAGAPPPANDITMTRVCCVAASSALSNAKKEVEYFESLIDQGVTVDQPKSKGELIEFLKTNDYDVIHFACHGQFNTTDPGESAIQLPGEGNSDDERLLRPDDLRTDNINQKISDNRPLIFINSCHSGRTGTTLVGVAGWAVRLLSWGCGAFIGCGWEVADSLAAEFAIAFYKNFRDQKSLAQSVHQARQQIRANNIKNSTWLAYYLYGNPNCFYKNKP